MNKSNERKFNEFILDEKLLNPFILNLCNLSNLLKLQLIKSIEELVFRFDIPLPLKLLMEIVIFIGLILNFTTERQAGFTENTLQQVQVFVISIRTARRTMFFSGRGITIFYVLVIKVIIIKLLLLHN